ncbi:hypothetical protein Tco_0952592, partial [Tanacetum coccineum]
CENCNNTNGDQDGLDRKSTTGGCQFLGSRLISWQCKKQTIVATSTTEAEYVAVASCCGQVLWIQNQMLDYGFNFMNTKIHIDNESTICIVKNPVYHSKTKHIEIRHHFIRDSYEKKLIRVEKIHTDFNVADLLTKAFDGPRFNFLVVNIVKQFWQTATALTLADGTLELRATIDTLEYTITEASVRSKLQLADASGISMLPNTEIFEGMGNMGYPADAEQLTHPTSLTPEPDNEPIEHTFEQPSPEHQPLLPRQETEVPQSQVPTHPHVAEKELRPWMPASIGSQVVKKMEDVIKGEPCGSTDSKDEDAKISSKLGGIYKGRRSKSVDKGKRYKRRKESKGKDIDTGFEDISTGFEDISTGFEDISTGFEEVNTGGLGVSTGSGRSSSARAKGRKAQYYTEGKVGKVKEEEPVKVLGKKKEAKGLGKHEEAYDRVHMSDSQAMFGSPLNEDAIWSLPLQQKMISWRYYDKCAVHCLTLEACNIYMLADRKYPLSKDACQVMLKMKLLDGKMNEVCYKLLKMIES